MRAAAKHAGSRLKSVASLGWKKWCRDVAWWHSATPHCHCHCSLQSLISIAQRPRYGIAWLRHVQLRLLVSVIEPAPASESKVGRLGGLPAGLALAEVADHACGHLGIAHVDCGWGQEVGVRAV